MKTSFTIPRRRWLARALTLACCLAALQLPGGTAQAVPASPDSVRIATFNITGNAQTRANYGLLPFSQALPLIASGIRDNDVVGLQEVSQKDSAAIASAAGFAYSAWVGDVALLSRYPLSGVTQRELPKPGCVLGINCGGPVWGLTATVTIGGVPIRIVNTHLSANYESNNRSEWRRAQADWVRTNWITPTPYRVVVVGDFNGEDTLAVNGPMKKANTSPMQPAAPASNAFCDDHVDEIYFRAPMDATYYDGIYGGDRPGCSPARLSDHARHATVLSLGTGVVAAPADDYWTGWVDASGPQTNDGVAPVYYGGNQWVFYRATDGRVRVAQTDGASRWWGDTLVPGSPTISGSPSVTVWKNQLHVFARGTNGQIWGNAYAGAWNGWGAVPGSASAEPPSVAVHNDQLVLVRVGTDRRAYTNRYTTSWGGWQLVPGSASLYSAATAATWRGNLQLFVRGADNKVFGNAFSTSWGSWSDIAGSWTLSAPTVETTSDGRLLLAIRGADDRVYVRSYWPGRDWGSWGVLALGRTFSAPAVLLNLPYSAPSAYVAGPDGHTYRNNAVAMT